MFGASRLLPLLIIVSFLSFAVRLSEVVTGVSTLSGAAFAEEKAEDRTAQGDMKKEESEEVEVVEGDKKDEPKWRDANDSSFDMMDVKFELFEDLSKRREELDGMEKKLMAREALLKAAEQELERKYQELTKLRNEIEALLERQSDEEEGRINSLVKIYEGMKPKDAARIFDTLDIDVLMSVVAKMSERKVSPIMAAMNPERVRTITIMLAEQKKLPTLR